MAGYKHDIYTDIKVTRNTRKINKGSFYICRRKIKRMWPAELKTINVEIPLLFEWL